MKILRSAAVLSTLALAAACAQQEEVLVDTPQQQTPIYGKDGTIIGMEPMVRPGRMMSDGTMSMDECSGVVPGGDDTDCEEYNDDLPDSAIDD